MRAARADRAARSAPRAGASRAARPPALAQLDRELGLKADNDRIQSELQRGEHERVAAAASIYGTSLITDRPDTPHLAPLRTAAEYYFACAETDRWAPLELVERLRSSLADAKNAEVEFYPGVEHGFAFPKRPVYDKPSAERHWERLFALFGRRLHGAEHASS